MSAKRNPFYAEAQILIGQARLKRSHHISGKLIQKCLIKCITIHINVRPSNQKICASAQKWISFGSPSRCPIRAQTTAPNQIYF